MAGHVALLVRDDDGDVVPELDRHRAGERRHQRVGAVDMLHPRDLTAEAITAWLAGNVGNPKQAHARLNVNLDGLATVADHVITTMAKEPVHV